MVISITALNVLVKIVHIPVISTSEAHTTKLYWTVEHAKTESTEFFNVTSNRLEIAIFAASGLVDGLWFDNLDGEIRKSDQEWRVFEITSGDIGDAGNYDSPHLRHVSAPLAREGISILYQSSYFTDFLLVKSEDFERASEIFTLHGWHVDPTNTTPSSRPRSILLSPNTPLSSSTSTSHSTRSSRSSASPPPAPPSLPEITVLSSPLACVGFPTSAEGTTAEKLRQLLVWPEQARYSWDMRRHARGDGEDGEGIGEVLEERLDEGRPFVSYTRTEDGASLVTEVKILRGLLKGYEGLGVDVQLEGDDDDQIGWMSDAGGDDGDDTDDEIDYMESTQRQPDDGERQDEATCHHPITGLHTPPPENQVRTLSLPATPKDFTKHSGESGNGTPTTIPIAWSGRILRSASGRKLPDIGTDMEKLDKEVQVKERSSGSGGGGRKRCLQLDLRGVGEGDMAARNVYHMDKSGLVTAFSDLLSTRSIRMLYSSTFHTANILVEARDVGRAKRLLENRGDGQWQR